jgi:hypothetical protein
VHCVKDKYPTWWYDSNKCSSSFYTCHDGHYGCERDVAPGTLCNIATGEIVCSTSELCQRDHYVPPPCSGYGGGSCGGGGSDGGSDGGDHNGGGSGCSGSEEECSQWWVTAVVYAEGVSPVLASGPAGTVTIREAVASLMSDSLGYVFSVDQVGVDVKKPASTGTGEGRRLKLTDKQKRVAMVDKKMKRSLQSSTGGSSYNVYAPTTTLIAADATGWVPPTEPLPGVTVLTTIETLSAGASELTIKVYLPPEVAIHGNKRMMRRAQDATGSTATHPAVDALNTAITPASDSGVCPLTATLADNKQSIRVTSIASASIVQVKPTATTTTSGGSGATGPVVTGSSTDSNASDASGSAVSPLIIGLAVGGTVFALALVAAGFIIARRRKIASENAEVARRREQAGIARATPSVAGGASATPAAVVATGAATRSPQEKKKGKKGKKHGGSSKATPTSGSLMSPTGVAVSNMESAGVVATPAATAAVPRGRRSLVDDNDDVDIQAREEKKPRSSSRHRSTSRKGSSRPHPATSTASATVLPGQLQDLDEEVLSPKQLKQQQQQQRRERAPPTTTSRASSASKRVVINEPIRSPKATRK